MLVATAFGLAAAMWSNDATLPRLGGFQERSFWLVSAFWKGPSFAHVRDDLLLAWFPVLALAVLALPPFALPLLLPPR